MRVAAAGATRQTDARTAVLDAAEALFAERGFAAVALREIARAAEVNVGTVTYHFGDKLGLLEAIYARHIAPMNARRMELMGEAARIADPDQRLMAVLRAWLLPALSDSQNRAGGGARFTRLRAALLAEGDAEARALIGKMFESANRRLVDALAECLPGAARADIVWRTQLMLGGLYYTLINPSRIGRLTDGAEDGGDHERAFAQIAQASFDSLRALAPRAGGERREKKR